MIGIGLKYSSTHLGYKSYKVKNNLVTKYYKSKNKIKLVCGGIYFFKKRVFSKMKKKIWI